MEPPFEFIQRIPPKLRWPLVILAIAVVEGTVELLLPSTAGGLRTMLEATPTNIILALAAGAAIQYLWEERARLVGAVRRGFRRAVRPWLDGPSNSNATILTWGGGEATRSTPPDGFAQRTTGDAKPPRTRTPDQLSPVAFIIEGAWLNTPFQRGELGRPAPGQPPVYTEDVYLTLTANDFLEHVRIEIVATEDDGSRRKHTYWHKGHFEGTITRGMTETFRVFRRTFDFERIAVRNENGGHTHTKRRRDKDLIIFDGTTSEAKPSAALISFEIRVHRKLSDGSPADPTSTFVLDVDRALAPQSRLVAGRGIEVKIPNNFVRQFGAAMIYEDIDAGALQTSNSTIVDVLVAFVERGLAIRNTFMQDNEPIRIRTDRAAWVKDVEGYLSANLEKVHLLKFKAARGDGLLPTNRSAEGGSLWADIGGKIDALNKVIDEIRSKTT